MANYSNRRAMSAAQTVREALLANESASVAFEQALDEKYREGLYVAALACARRIDALFRADLDKADAEATPSELLRVIDRLDDLLRRARIELDASPAASQGLMGEIDEALSEP